MVGGMGAVPYPPESIERARAQPEALERRSDAGQEALRETFRYAAVGVRAFEMMR